MLALGHPLYSNNPVLNIRTICQTQDLWKLACLVTSCIYYACQTHEIYQVLLYSVDFKAPKELWNPLSKAVLNECSIISIKGPSEMTVKLKSNLYIGPVIIFPNFWHWQPVTQISSVIVVGCQTNCFQSVVQLKFIWHNKVCMTTVW